MTPTAAQLNPALSWRAQAWSPVWFYNHVPELGVIFCAVPKNGCRTLKRVFMRQGGIEIGLDEFRPTMHAEVAERWSMSNVPRSEREAVLERHKLVVFLRDPLLRIASAFADRVVRVPEREGNLAMYDEVWAAESLPGTPGPDRSVSFAEFVRHLTRTPCDAMDQHWKPQVCFTQGRRFDFVGDVSRLGPDLNRLQRWLGIDVGEVPDHPQTARSGGTPGEHAQTPAAELHRAGVRPGAASLFTPELEALVRARYAEDVDLIAHWLPGEAG